MEDFSESKGLALQKTFRLLQNQIFFSLSSIHPWEISEQVMNYLCLLSVTNFGAANELSLLTFRHKFRSR
jgi:hypothetical protein